jgi:hypothetical protein
MSMHGSGHGPHARSRRAGLAEQLTRRSTRAAGSPSMSSPPSPPPSRTRIGWADLPHELAAHVLQSAWDLWFHRGGSIPPSSRKRQNRVHPSNLCLVSSQWALETRKNCFRRLRIASTKKYGWLLDHLEDERRGRLCFEFATLVREIVFECRYTILEEDTNTVVQCMVNRIQSIQT